MNAKAINKIFHENIPKHGNNLQNKILANECITLKDTERTGVFCLTTKSITVIDIIFKVFWNLIELLEVSIIFRVSITWFLI